MKKSSISIALASLMTVGAANAAFLQPGSTGSIEITGACFTFGDCSVGGTGDVSANTIQVNGIGGGPGGGVIGNIDFTVGANGNDITLTSYAMSTYQGTAGGDFATQMTSFTGSSVINDDGSMTLDMNGRTGIAQFFIASLGEQPWNIDNATSIASSGNFQVLTSGTSSNIDPNGGTAPATKTGSDLTSAGAGMWTGTVVSAGNVGASWGFFDGTPYTEVFNIKVTGVAAGGSTVPVPAAAWLFGSGLIGLVGVARRRKA